MKQQKQTNNRTNKKKNNNNSAQTSPSEKTLSRRELFSKFQYGAVATLALGGFGWFMVEEATAMFEENDLTRVGNGIPTIVQIHDPQCPKCVALQRETREALESFDDGQLQYLVANIKRSTGQDFAAAHNVGHVTLLLFDGAGRRRQILVGPNESHYLTNAFQSHLDKYGKS